MAEGDHAAAYRTAQAKLAAEWFHVPAGTGAAAQLGAAQGAQETMPAQVQHQKQDCIPTSQPAVLGPTTIAASAIAAIPSGVTLSCLIPSVQSVASTTAARVTGTYPVQASHAQMRLVP